MSTDIHKFDGSIGVFTWWDLDQTKVTPAHLRRVLADHGFEAASAVPDIDPVSGIGRAAREWAQGRGNAARYKAEVTYTDAGQVVVGLLTRNRLDSKTVEWDQVGYLTYDLGSAAWTVATSQAHEDACASFVEVANDRMAYLDHRWVRPNILAHTFGKLNAISLRKRGGMYFVPKQHVEALRGLRRVLKAIGNSTLEMASIGSDEESVEAVASSTREAVLSSVEEIEAQLEAWRESSRAVRSDSQRNVLGALGDLLGMADLYESALEVKLDDLRSTIEAARRRALEIIADQVEAA